MIDRRLVFEPLAVFLADPAESMGERVFVSTALLDHRMEHRRWPRFVGVHSPMTPYAQVPDVLRARGYRGFGDRILLSVDTRNGGESFAWDPDVVRQFELVGNLPLELVQDLAGRAG